MVPCNHTGLIVLGFINCNTNAFQSLTQLHGKFLIFVAAANKEEWLIFFFGGIIFLTVPRFVDVGLFCNCILITKDTILNIAVN